MMHAAAYIQQQQKVQGIRFVLEVDNPLRRIFVEHFEIVCDEPGNGTAVSIGDRGIHLHQGDARPEGGRLRR